jgi:Fe-S cluster assembly ATP-binding protein
LLLEIRGLRAAVADSDTEILKGVDLTVKRGEVHAIMGPNGSGKSTLANILAGKPDYVVTRGEVLYQGEDLLAMTPDQRAREGVFLAFQYPVSLPGVRGREFVKAAMDAKRTHRGEEELTFREFDRLYREAIKTLDIDTDLMKRSVNDGFSGGEKKRNEMVQMALLDPQLAVLDETDSGLDIDALKTVATGVNRQRSDSNAIVLVTHYQRMLNYVAPDYVHVLVGGRIVTSGGAELALELEARGYEWVKEAAGNGAAEQGG